MAAISYDNEAELHYSLLASAEDAADLRSRGQGARKVFAVVDPFAKALESAIETGVVEGSQAGSVLSSAKDAATASEDEDGKTRYVAVFLHADKFWAMDNACYHHGGPMSEGDSEF